MVRKRRDDDDSGGDVTVAGWVMSSAATAQVEFVRRGDSILFDKQLCEVDGVVRRLAARRDGVVRW